MKFVILCDGMFDGVLVLVVCNVVIVLLVLWIVCILIDVLVCWDEVMFVLVECYQVFNEGCVDGVIVFDVQLCMVLLLCVL